MPPYASPDRDEDDHRRDDAGSSSEHGHGRERYEPTRSGRAISYTAGYSGASRHGSRAPGAVGEVVFSTPAGDVVAPAFERRTFPSRTMIRDADTRRIHDVKRVLSKAPWWDTEAIRDRRMIGYYENVDGMLPDGLPRSVVDSFDFHQRCLVPECDLFAGRADKPASIKHIMDVYARSARMPSGEPILASYGMDLYCYRTSSEVEYVEQLRCLGERRWEGIRDVAQDALCFVRPILRADFRYERKADSPYWVWAKWERRMRRNDGLFVSYRCVEYQNFRPDKRIGRWPRILPFFEDVEIPPHCYADLPPVLAFKGSHLIRDVFSGWWVVFYTGYAAKVAAFILWDVYDRLQLWRLPALLIEWMRLLDLSVPSGSLMNERDLHHLLEVIEEMDWCTGEVVDINDQLQRPGATVPEPEFIFYDPWRRERFGREEVATRRRRANHPKKLDGHPTGFTYSPALPPLAVRQLSWTPYHANLIPETHVYEEEDGTMVYTGAPVNERHGMVLDRPPAKQRRRDDGQPTPIPSGGPPTGSSAAHAALGGVTPPVGAKRTSAVRDRQTPTDLEIDLATGEYLGQLGISPGAAGNSLLADIKTLIRKRVGDAQSPQADAADESAAPCAAADCLGDDPPFTAADEVMPDTPSEAGGSKGDEPAPGTFG